MDQNWQKPLRFDWAGENGPPFTEEDIYNCEISRILRNDFHAPWDPPEPAPDLEQQPWWNPNDSIGKNLQRAFTYIPDKQQTQYPQLSTLTKQQHLLGLRVLNSEYGVQPSNYPSPTQDDFGSFLEMTDLYEKEQRDYRIWARMCWANGDCIRTLQPKPLLETVYKAQFELKKNEIHTLPHNFKWGTQISLEKRTDTFELQPLKDLKKVDLKSLPEINLEQDVSVLQPYAVPNPCQQHSSRFVLPRENTVSVLPLPEIHRELAHYAMENRAVFIASENSLQCLLETDRNWMIPVSVCEVSSPGGHKRKNKKREEEIRQKIRKLEERLQPPRRRRIRDLTSSDELPHGVKTVVAVGKEFAVKMECGAMRSLKAFRHLLHKFKKSSSVDGQIDVDQTRDESQRSSEPTPGCSFERSRRIDPEVAVPVKHDPRMYLYIEDQTGDQFDLTKLTAKDINAIIGVDPSNDMDCTCKGTTHELANARSFKKWKVKNAARSELNESFDLIIHSSHKVREGNKEVILEPIVEWQPELGACKQSEGRLRALALSLMMRPKAELINVRVDYSNGNIILIDKLDEEKFIQWHGDKRSEIADIIHRTIDQLRFLKQGQYILAHDTIHGANAMIYSALPTGFVGTGENTLSLRPVSDHMSSTEEAACAKNPPELSQAILPYHKDLGILPLAFISDKNHVKENKQVTAALAKARLPPKAVQWKRKKRKRKKKKQRPKNAN